MVRVLIVDDSAFMRNAIASMLLTDPDIEVIGIARDGKEAVEKVASLKPDIVTLDVEMPRMDGIEALKQIMAHNPVPVLMVSSLTTEGAKVTLDALDLGAVDFIPKNLADLSVNIVKIKEALIDKVKVIARQGIMPYAPEVQKTPIKMPEKAYHSAHRRSSIIVIGSSTGGPKALQSIVTRFPADFPVPVLIAQHMPPNFTGPFSERLDQLSSIQVKEAEEGDLLQKGIVYIAPGTGHMGVTRKKITETLISITSNNENYIYKPSVDALMLSVVELFSGQVLGVILTGLGNDGEKGMKEIKNKGGRTIAQSKDTCVVYGMPRSVIQAGLADKIVPLDEVASEIINAV